MKRLLLACLLLGLAARAQPIALGERSYRLHVPLSHPEGALPLVLVLHGGGGTAGQAERSLGFDALADREGFLVAYPEGQQKSWNDGRNDPHIAAQRHQVDDVAFVRAVVADIERTHPVKPGWVFATGISNGAMMSSRLGADAADLFAAVAPVAGQLPSAWAERVRPARPVSALLINGTEDPLVPYEGGQVIAFGQSRGAVQSSAASVRYWVDADGCRAQAEPEALPDLDGNDGCRVRRDLYSHGREGSEVVFYSVEGGGHTWPGGSQYLPVRMVGRVCRDFDATRVIWDFFKSHPRP